MEKCPECGSTNIIWDGVAYIWLCNEPDCLWSGQEEDLAEEVNVIDELLEGVDTSYFWDKRLLGE